MRLNGRTISGLKQALKEQRQFTLGEQMIADEMLGALRRGIQQFIDPVGPNPHDSDLTRRMKRLGLFEISQSNDVGDLESLLDIEGQDCDADFVRALLQEAVRGYVAHPSHAKGIPASIAAAHKERAEMAARPLQLANADRLDGTEANQRATTKRLADSDEALSVLTECVQRLDARIAALESAAHSPEAAPAQTPEAAPAQTPEAAPADTKGQ